MRKNGGGLQEGRGRRPLAYKSVFRKARQGRVAIDSVMLMDKLRTEVGYGGEVYGRDIKSAFNSLRRRSINKLQGLSDWIDHCLSPRSFEIKADGEVIGRTQMTYDRWYPSRLPSELGPIHGKVVRNDREAEEALKMEDRKRNLRIGPQNPSPH